MSLNQGVTVLEKIVNYIEGAIPNLVDDKNLEKGKKYLLKLSDELKDDSLPGISNEFRVLGTTLKIILTSNSMILSNPVFHVFLLSIAETVKESLELIVNGAPINDEEIRQLRINGEFMITVASRLMKRYKLQVFFEKDYEAKSLRAFMLAKELSSKVRFLSVNPDISSVESPNLEKGLEFEVLSNESADKLYKIATEVLSVKSVNIFVEKSESEVVYVDPPFQEDSIDAKMESYLND